MTHSPPKCMSMSWYPDHVNISLLGKRVLGDVIKDLEVRFPGWALDPMTYVLLSQRRRRQTQRRRWHENKVRDWNDESASHTTPGTSRSWKRQDPAPQNLRGRVPLNTPWQGPSGLQYWERVTFYCWSHPVCGHSCSSHKKLIQSRYIDKLFLFLSSKEY